MLSHRKSLGRFVVVGAVAFLVDYVLYRLLSLWILPLYAKPISFVVATMLTFTCNTLWTFERSSLEFGRLVRFVALYTVTTAVNATTNQLILSMTGSVNLGFMSATGVAMGLNYGGLRYFVYPHRKSPTVTSRGEPPPLS